jgi:hypothetical protein
MLDAARANTKAAAINEAFASIGNAGDTKMPRSKRNDEPIAWAYHVAAHLARIAEAQKRKAIAAAVKAGVMFDPEKQPMVEGTHALIYSGEVVQIEVEVTAARTHLDTDALFADLAKAGVKQTLIDRLVTKHTHNNRPPHKFTSSLMTE